MRWISAPKRVICGVLGIGLTGCFSTGPKPQSGWAVLESAEPAKCNVWPLREKDLGVKEVMLAGRGFVFTGTKRDAAPMHYFAPFGTGPKMDVEDFVALDLGRGAVLIGGTSAGGKDYAFIARNAAGAATLEVRTVRDNVIRFKGPLADKFVEEGRAVAAPGGAWLSVKGDDDKYRLLYLSTGEKMALTAVPAATRGEPSRVLVRPSEPKGALLVWREGETGEPLRSQWVTTDGKAEAAVKLPVPVASQLESWTAMAHGGGYYLAVIDGDSLIGQSELKITFFNWDSSGAQVRWTKATVQRDEHVTEPVFMVSEAGLEALVLKWIDEESTIARYMVAAGTVGKPEFSGVFQKGSRIVEAFTDADGDDRFVVVRSRGENGWIFRVCEI